MDKDGQFKYYFVLRDHLGNTRVTFSDLNNDDEINEKEEVIQINNYYAFGLNMEGNWNGKDGANKYQYNSKEWNDDFGLGWNDFGARFYDPSIARWSAIDPLAEKYLRHSPYNYCVNNPARFIDPDGIESRDIWGSSTFQGGAFMDENGNMSGTTRAKDDNSNSKDNKAKLNVLITLETKEHKNVTDARNKDTDKTFNYANTGWLVFSVANTTEAEAILKKFADKSIDNLVIGSHGGAFSNKGSYMCTAAVTGDGGRIFATDVKKNPFIKSALSKVADGGAVVFAVCNMGSIPMANELGKASTSRLSIYTYDGFCKVP